MKWRKPKRSAHRSSPLDALIVINHLNDLAPEMPAFDSNGEGHPSAMDSDWDIAMSVIASEMVQLDEEDDLSPKKVDECFGTSKHPN